MTQVLRCASRALLAAGCWFALALAAAPARAAHFDIAVDAAPLAGSSGWLAFDLLAGDGAVVNTVAITAFTTTGSLAGSSMSGSVSGSLAAPPLLLQSSSFFSEYLQAIDFGSGQLRFGVDTTANAAAGAIPDALSFFILDTAFAPVPTSDPTGADALFVVDLTARPAVVAYASPFATVSAVPEPAVWWLLAVGLAPLAGPHRRKSPAATGNGRAFLP